MGKFGVIIYYWVFILGALLVMYVLGIADNNSLVITLLAVITAVYAVTVGSYKIALHKKEEKSKAVTVQGTIEKTKPKADSSKAGSVKAKGHKRKKK